MPSLRRDLYLTNSTFMPCIRGWILIDLFRFYLNLIFFKIFVAFFFGCEIYKIRRLINNYIVPTERRELYKRYLKFLDLMSILGSNLISSPSIRHLPFRKEEASRVDQKSWRATSDCVPKHPLRANTQLSRWDTDRVGSILELQQELSKSLHRWK